MTEAGAGLALIVGHYKSGSTWLVNLLSLHPEVRGVSETHVFRYAFESADLAKCTDILFSKTAWSEGGQAKLIRRRLADWARPLTFWRPNKLPVRDRPTTLHDLSYRNQNRLWRTLRSSTSPEEYCRKFFAFLWDTLSPGKYLVEKTPTNIFEVPRIKRVFPEAKLIAVFRDGRDVVVSDKCFRANQGVNNFTLADSIGKWRRAMEVQIEYAANYDMLTFSYESLLSQPEDTVRQVLSYLGLPEDRSVIQDMVRRASFEFITGRKRGVEDAKSFYRKGSAGDWINFFTPQDKQFFAGQAGHILVELGYEATADCRDWAGEANGGEPGGLPVGLLNENGAP